MPSFQTQDYHIHYEVIGSGKPIVLIHGFTNHGFAWSPQVSDLVYAGYQVILPDLPCHGMSKPVEHTVTVPDMAAVLVSLLDFIGIDKTSVCGLSLGGMVVQMLLTEHAERIEKAVVANSSSNFTSETARAAVAQWKQLLVQPGGAVLRLERTWDKLVHPAFRATDFADSVYQSWENVQKQVDGRGLAHVADGMVQFDARSNLPSVQAPTLVIGGKQDQLIPAGEARIIHDALPGSKLVVLDEAGHLSNLDAARQFNQLLLEFLG